MRQIAKNPAGWPGFQSRDTGLLQQLADVLGLPVREAISPIKTFNFLENYVLPMFMGEEMGEDILFDTQTQYTLRPF